MPGAAKSMNEAPTRQDNLKSVQELIAERPALDNTATFLELRTIQDEIWTRITARFALERDASTLDFESYTSPDGAATGTLQGFTGPEVDWAIKAWIGNPARSFCNLHITLWLGPNTRVPHLGLACGTFPVIFMFLDYLPRVDVRLQPEYLDQYLQPVNERFMQMQADARMKPFISQNVFVRAAVSPVGLNFIAPPNTEGVVEQFRNNAHEMVDRWLGWVDEAEPVPEAERAALAANDLTLRRNIAERDPANVVAETIYGKEMTDRLVRGLWGGDRVTPRIES
jgi:hypothetical protein